MNQKDRDPTGKDLVINFIRQHQSPIPSASSAEWENIQQKIKQLPTFWGEAKLLFRSPLSWALAMALLMLISIPAYYSHYSRSAALVAESEVESYLLESFCPIFGNTDDEESNFSADLWL